MPAKKRTSTKKPSRQDIDSAVAARKRYWAKLAETKHYIFRELFPSYGAAIAELDNPIRPVWFDNSEAMRRIRMQADEEWKALTGLPTLDAYNPDRWFMVAVAAGYSLPEVEQMSLKRLREIIIPWALAKRGAENEADQNTAPHQALLIENRIVIGDKTIVLENQQWGVVKALVDLGAANLPQLRTQSGYKYPHNPLKRLLDKHTELRAVISLPGGRGKGGYSTTIKLPSTTV